VEIKHPLSLDHCKKKHASDKGWHIRANLHIALKQMSNDLSSFSFITNSFRILQIADPGGCEVQDVGLPPLAC
jgi:hypothetical protein